MLFRSSIPFQYSRYYIWLLLIGVALYFFTWGISSMRNENNLVMKQRRKDTKLGKVIRGGAFFFLIAGLAFRFLHWPFSSVLLLLAIALGIIGALLHFTAPVIDDDTVNMEVIDDMDFDELDEVPKFTQVKKNPLLIRVLFFCVLFFIGFGLLSIVYFSGMSPISWMALILGGVFTVGLVSMKRKYGK